jgi:cytochrome c peroxidase
MRQVSWIVITLLLLAETSVFAADAELLIRRANRFFSPLPDAMPGSENDTLERIELGKKLFFEKRLSVNDSQSWTCRGPGRAGKGADPQCG